MKSYKDSRVQAPLNLIHLCPNPALQIPRLQNRRATRSALTKTYRLPLLLPPEVPLIRQPWFGIIGCTHRPESGHPTSFALESATRVSAVPLHSLSQCESILH